MRSFLLASSLLVAGLSAPALAQTAAPTAAPSDITITGNVTAVTDYRFRGISQSSRHFAIQGGGTIAHSSGFYISGWSSSIDDYVAAGADAELDLIAGYTKTIDGFTLDGGMLYYVYPGAVKGVNTDFFEPYGSAKYTYGPVTLKGGFNYAWKQKAIASPIKGHTRDDNLYVYGEASGAIPKTPITLTAHLGHNTGRSLLTNGLKGYYDWSLTGNYTWNKLTFGVSYVDTDFKKGEFTLPNGKQGAGAGVVASVGVAF